MRIFLKSLVCLAFLTLALPVFAQSVVEVEARGTITFNPDSFVVLIRINEDQISLENRPVVKATDAPRSPEEEIHEVIAVEEDFGAVDVVAEPVEVPSIREESTEERRARLQKERERYRAREDSLRSLRRLRLNEFSVKLAQLNIKPLFVELEELRDPYGYNRGSNRTEWPAVLSPAQMAKVDSLSQVYGRPLSFEILSIRMKNHDEIKRKAYKAAMESGRSEATVLASAMNKKLGKLLEVQTQSMGIEELLPVVMRKELSREIRRNDGLRPELYQLMQEFNWPAEMPKGRVEREVLQYSWTESVKMRFETLP